MRSTLSLLILSVALLGCNGTLSPEPISQVNGGTQVVLQSEIDNYEVIQEFDIDNCDGKADATRIEHRSSSIDVTVSTELAARIGASAQVVSADVQAAVGTALSMGGERGTSIEVKAPPNTHMFFQLAWVGKSRIGVVQNVSGSNVPIAFQSFSPDNVRIKSQYDIGCRNTPTPTTQNELQPTVTQSVSSQPPTSVIQTPISRCPSVISRQLIEQWAQIGETSKSTAQNSINDFDRMRVGGEYKIGDVLPTGVAIITDFGNGESDIYLTLPVRAIAHYHSWGVFEVTSEYKAIQTGSCMTIIP